MDKKSGSFGTSEDRVYGSGGALMNFIEETAEMCQSCEDAATGGVYFGIVRETGGSATLVCPNCGETKHVFSADVIRKAKE